VNNAVWLRRSREACEGRRFQNEKRDNSSRNSEPFARRGRFARRARRSVSAFTLRGLCKMCIIPPQSKAFGAAAAAHMRNFRHLPSKNPAYSFGNSGNSSASDSLPQAPLRATVSHRAPSKRCPPIAHSFQFA
jgi:hypothetical protein